LKLVETLADFKSFKTQYERQPSVVIPIFSDSREHPGSNTLCFLGAYLFTDRILYGLPFNHYEATNLPLDWVFQLTNGKIFTPDKKRLMYVLFNTPKMYDIQSLEYVSKGSITNIRGFRDNVTRELQQKYLSHNDVNRVVPIYKLMEYCANYIEHIVELLDNRVELMTTDPHGYQFLSDIAIPALHFIESAGLHVDEAKFRQHFGSKGSVTNNIVFSEYNLFTAAGRPSCRYGGINYAALNKDDGTRTAFTSRFDDGKLFLIDFESFHVRLIGALIDYKLPDTSVHEYFGKQYFNTDNLTQEQYDESKVMTFRNLYSDIESEIPFFRKVRVFKQQLWEQINRIGFIQSPLYKKRIQLCHIWEPSVSKVFNYLVQFMETEYNMTALSALPGIYAGKKSKVILYTYDSILIDYSYSDGPLLLRDTIDLLETNVRPERFPTRVYCGDNYGEMTKVDMFKP
jgi:hypothetical protein